MTIRLLVLAWFGALLCAATSFVVPLAHAEPRVVTMLREAGGRYVFAAASMTAADCSGLVSVVQSLATGQPIRRLGDTSTFMAGRWPGIVYGATPGDRFVIGANHGHMVARIDGVNIEATTSGQPFRFGADAASPFDARFTRRAHIDPVFLV